MCSARARLTEVAEVAERRGGETKNSPSRFCFRPHVRWTFGFRLRPVGDASSYSQPVLGAAVTVLDDTPPFKASSTFHRPAGDICVLQP